MHEVNGLKVTDVVVGRGARAARGSTVTIRYTGYLNHGTVFQSEMEITFTLGGRTVIAGLEYGVEDMCVGGKRSLQVSPHLAYRETGVPGIIPAHAKLRFEVELIAVSGAQVASAPAV
jgi:FKBP-type peptidyl-prolyl cis-trans isomerase